MEAEEKRCDIGVIGYRLYDEDEISDYLSDTTGYCHKGFYLEE